jgi:hypothetical protein
MGVELHRNLKNYQAFRINTALLKRLRRCMRLTQVGRYSDFFRESVNYYCNHIENQERKKAS